MKAQRVLWVGVLTVVCLMIVGFRSLNVMSKPGPVVVLYTARDPILPRLPKDCCLWVSLENLPTEPLKAQTVIVAGHGLPPYFAEHNVEHVARAVAFFDPELVVMNSCYGASLDILSALASQDLKAYVVAPAFRIYYPGFDYGSAFLDPQASLMDKLKAVHTVPRYPLLRWKLDQAPLQALQERVDQMSVSELKSHLQRVDPALVRLTFPTLFEPNSEILVPVSDERFK